MTKRKRRTKAEMELARANDPAEVSQGKGFRDIFDVLDETPTPKTRHRRTKVQIAKDNAKLAKVEAEKYSVPKNNTVFLDRPAKSKIPLALKPDVKPKPKEKFDADLIGEKLGIGTGLVLGKVPMKKDKNFHIVSWNNLDKDWKVMYNGLYNSLERQTHVWNSFAKCKEQHESTKKEIDNGSTKKRRPRKSKVGTE
tara:strand:- start:109 stop:696 length:588 start_codon:yes stop_codon:yes gene_type:complete